MSENNNNIDRAPLLQEPSSNPSTITLSHDELKKVVETLPDSRPSSSNFSLNNFLHDIHLSYYFSYAWTTIDQHFVDLLQDRKRQEYLRCNIHQFKREWFIWIWIHVGLVLMSAFSISLGATLNNGASIAAGVLDLLVITIGVDAMMVTYQNPNKYTQEISMAVKKIDNEAAYGSFRSEISLPVHDPKVQKILLAIFSFGIFICEIIFFFEDVAILFPIGIHIALLLGETLMPWFYPSVVKSREEIDFPEGLEPMKYAAMARKRHFDSDWYLTGLATEEKLKGYFNKKKYRCCCLHTATDEIQLTNYRAVMIRTVHPHFWNCYQPDMQDYVTAWLPKTPSLYVFEPPTYCCCYSVSKPPAAAEFASLCCTCDPCGCMSMDAIGCYDHGPCCPSKQVVLGEEGNLNFRVVVDAKDEKKLVARFYEATEKWNGIFKFNPKHQQHPDNNNLPPVYGNMLHPYWSTMVVPPPVPPQATGMSVTDTMYPAPSAPMLDVTEYDIYDEQYTAVTTEQRMRQQYQEL